MNQDYQTAKLFAGAIATIGLYSVLYKENKFYRFFEHLFLGLAVGWAVVTLWTDVLKDSWWTAMMGSTGPAGEMTQRGYWAYVLLVPIGLMGYFVFTKKHNWISQIPIGIILGLLSGQQLQVWWNRYGPQIYDSLRPVVPTVWDPFTTPDIAGATPAAADAVHNTIYPSQAIGNVVFLITLLSVISYFLFSFRQENGFTRRASTLGRWMLMVGFGAIFGTTVMMRFTLVIDRMYFIFIEFLQNGVWDKFVHR